MTIRRRDFLALTLGLPALATPGRDGGHLTLADRRDRGEVRHRLGASTACVAGVSLIEAIRTIERLGFGTIELIAYTGASHSVGAIPGFDYAAASQPERRRVYEATRSFRHISAHMPFADVTLLSGDRAVRQEGIRRIRDAMDGLAYLNGSMAVVHAGWPEEGQSFREVWPLMLETFRALGDYAGARGLKIGLETMQPDSVDDYVGLITDIDHPAVGATIDTGHIRGARDIALSSRQRHTPEGTERFNDILNRTAHALGEKLLHVHLTDVRSTDWVDHREVGTGIIDFARFFETLDELDYSGLLVFELEESEQLSALRASKARIERILEAR